MRTLNLADIHDWRGTPIEPGQIVVYGGPVNRSIQQVEGQVEGFTKSGRVRVRVIRRSYTTGSKEIVDVGPDRLTVVESLPPTTNATQAEEYAAVLETRRIYATHNMPSYWLDGPPWTNPNRVCVDCGATYAESRERECTLM